MTRKFDAVIFDIDNVLVDTRASYTDCIIKTVTTYLESLGFQTSRSALLSRKDVEIFKSLGGFNDDWDTCYGLLLYLLKLKIQRKNIRALTHNKNFQGLKKTVSTLPLGVKGAEAIFGVNKQVSLKKIEEIFQRFYLSDFVWNEKLIMPKPFISKIRKAGAKIGIVTGRNREEANFALRRFKIDAYIDTMITVDETPLNKKKPHPYGLIKVSEKLGGDLNYLYVGDLPDDLLAAKAAKKKIRIKSCGFLAASNMPKDMRCEFKKIPADYICGSLKELRKIILSS